MPDRWRYPPELLEALAPLGLAPTARTPPALARGAVNELYKFELRRLRDRLRAGLIDRASVAGHVVALRRKYWMLTLPLAAWERICDATSSPTSP